jgi:hypothetical protein
MHKMLLQKTSREIEMLKEEASSQKNTDGAKYSQVKK